MGYHAWDDPPDVAEAKSHAANLLAQHAKQPVVHTHSDAVVGVDHVIAANPGLRRKIDALIAQEKAKERKDAAITEARAVQPKAGILGQRPIFEET